MNNENVFVPLMILILFIGIIIGGYIATIDYRDQAIEHNCAQCNSTTAEFDADGVCTGDYINYSEEDDPEQMKQNNYRLVMMDSQSGTFLDENNCYWCPIDEFYNAVK